MNRKTQPDMAGLSNAFDIMQENAVLFAQFLYNENHANGVEGVKLAADLDEIARLDKIDLSLQHPPEGVKESIEIINSAIVSNPTLVLNALKRRSQSLKDVLEKHTDSLDTYYKTLPHIGIIAEDIIETGQISEKIANDIDAIRSYPKSALFAFKRNDAPLSQADKLHSRIDEISRKQTQGLARKPFSTIWKRYARRDDSALDIKDLLSLYARVCLSYDRAETGIRKTVAGYAEIAQALETLPQPSENEDFKKLVEDFSGTIKDINKNEVPRLATSLKQNLMDSAKERKVGRGMRS